MPVLDALVRQVLHLGRVADERVVVEALEDLLVGHAAPRVWSRWPSRSASVFASSIRSGASWAMRSEVRRAEGPEIESAASASPCGPEDGRGERGEADLELVDATSRSRARGRAASAFGAGVAVREEALAVRGVLERNLAPDPVGDADEVRGVLLREVLDAVDAGDGEVDRLAARVGEPAEARRRELDERRRGVAVRVAEEDRPGGQPAAVAEPLHEPLALERRDEPRGRALRQAGALGELADRGRLRGFDDAHEQLRRAVDRLGAGRVSSHLTSWNDCSTEILPVSERCVK